MTEKLYDTEEDSWKIKEILNNEYSDDILDDTIFISGIPFHHSERTGRKDELLEELYSENLSFTRTGYKEISYDRWVETHWTDWD